MRNPRTSRRESNGNPIATKEIPWATHQNPRTTHGQLLVNLRARRGSVTDHPWATHG